MFIMQSVSKLSLSESSNSHDDKRHPWSCAYAKDNQTTHKPTHHWYLIVQYFTSQEHNDGTQHHHTHKYSDNLNCNVPIRNNTYIWSLKTILQLRTCYPFVIFTDIIKMCFRQQYTILSYVPVTNNVGPGLGKWVYLLLIHTTSNYM
jgi:hypothetical protein